MTELAQRAVACKHWRWMAGMRAVSPSGKHWRVWSDTRSVYEPEGCIDSAPAEWSKDVPDLTDPATLGCLLALVREAWGKTDISCWRTAGGSWVCVTLGPHDPPAWDVTHYGPTEAAALVAALEAAP